MPLTSDRTQTPAALVIPNVACLMTNTAYIVAFFSCRIELSVYIAALPDESAACYTGRKTNNPHHMRVNLIIVGDT